MAKSSAKYMEVRWRLKGSDEAWSTPERVSPASDYVPDGFDRSETYEFEFRAVSNCGAKSDWAAAIDHTVPDAPEGTLTLADIKDEIDDAADEAAAANAALAAIASDNMLTSGEKPTVIRDYNVIITEQAGIDAQATAYGITTEKTAYDAKVATLTSYLATLTSPTDWDDISGNTTIVGATFRARFADVYTSRQALLNAIYAAAKAKADAATDLASQAGIINGFFDAGSQSGWTLGSGFVISSSHEIDPMSGSYFMTFYDAPGSGTYYARNKGRLPVKAGSVVKAVAYYRNRYCSAAARLRVEWRGVDDALIDSTTVALSASGSGDSGWQFAQQTPVAPAGTYFANLAVSVSGYSGSGAWHFDNCDLTRLADSADDVPESAARKWAAESGADVTSRNTPFGPNCIINPGAETGDLWPHYVNGGGGTWSVGNQGRLHSGSQSFLFSYAGQTSEAGILFNSGDRFDGVKHQPFANEGEVWRFSGFLYDFGTGAGATILCYLTFRDAAGAIVGSAAATLRPSGTVEYPFEVIAAAPAGTVYATASIRPQTDSEHTGYLIIDDVELRKADVSDKGSGVRVGDLRNLVMVGVGNYSSGWSGGGITYSSTSTSATISVAAATLVFGNNSRSYNASSTTVSGTAGTTRRYYLYYDDPTYAGGSRTLQATTSQITSVSGDGNLNVGDISVTFPSSGTGSGSGQTPCPDENAWVLRADPNGIRADWPVRAKTIRAGHFLRLTDGRPGVVTYSERKPAPRVRVVSRTGDSLTCSTSAPLELAGTAGECVLAPEAAGHWIKALADDSLLAAFVERVEDAGPGYVQHITCENACFWTGDDPGYLFGHHNLKP